MTRLRKFFKNEDSYNNLINIYKQLKKEREIEMILFLKAIVACCLTKQTWDEKTQSFIRVGMWLTPDAYFSPYGLNFSEPYTIEKLERQYNRYKISLKKHHKYEVFGEEPKTYMHKLLECETYII
jgi:hypothetical protein